MECSFVILSCKRFKIFCIADGVKTVLPSPTEEAAYKKKKKQFYIKLCMIHLENKINTEKKTVRKNPIIKSNVKSVRTMGGQGGYVRVDGR